MHILVILPVLLDILQDKGKCKLNDTRLDN